MSNKLNLAALLDRLELSGLSPSGIFVCPLCRHKVHYPECPFVALRAARGEGMVPVLVSRRTIRALQAVNRAAEISQGDNVRRAYNLVALDLAAVLKGDRS
jgi:primosomal replication protein N